MRLGQEADRTALACAWEQPRRRPTLQAQKLVELLLIVVAAVVVAACTQNGARSPSVGTVLRSDALTDPRSGILPRASTNPDAEYGYIGGEYQVATTNPSAGGTGVPVPGTYTDTSVEVDARLAGDPTNQSIDLYCRGGQGSGGVDEYRMAYYPWISSVVLQRIDAGAQFGLAGPARGGPPIAEGQTYHLLLACAGDAISGSINGAEVLWVRDATYRAGWTALGTSTLLTPGTSDARFRNLVIKQASRSAAPPTSAKSRPGTVFASDDFLDPATGILPIELLDQPHAQGGYQSSGEYRIEKIEANLNSIEAVSLPGPYADVSISVQVHVNRAPGGQAFFLGCRTTGGTSPGGYRLDVSPFDGDVTLYRLENRNPVPLKVIRASSSVHRDNAVNDVRLTCSGSSISAEINGTKVASVEDRTYASGEVGLGGYMWPDHLPANFDLRFTRLALSQP